MSRFDNIKYDDRTVEKSAKIQEQFEKLEGMVTGFPDGRSKSQILTHLETAFMWVGKALRDQQLTPGARGTKRAGDVTNNTVEQDVEDDSDENVTEDRAAS